jgi:hypothetical protein
MKPRIASAPATAVLGAIAALLAACIPSVNPFYTDADRVTDERILGTWFDSDGGTWTFSTTEQGGLRLALADKQEDGADKTGLMRAQLLKIGPDGHLFLDLVADDVDFDPRQADLVSMSVFPGHLLARIHRVEPTLELSFFDWDWLRQHLEARPGALAHRREGDDTLLLTAPTEALQAFVLAHLAEGELFGDAGAVGKLSRTPPPPEPAAAPEPAAPPAP